MDRNDAHATPAALAELLFTAQSYAQNATRLLEDAERATYRPEARDRRRATLLTNIATVYARLADTEVRAAELAAEGADESESEGRCE